MDHTPRWSMRLTPVGGQGMGVFVDEEVHLHPHVQEGVDPDIMRSIRLSFAHTEDRWINFG